MIKYDFKKIGDIINKSLVMDILDYYNIEHDSKNVICPKHADTSLGSCKITEHGCHCFACSTNSTIWEIVKFNNPDITLDRYVHDISSLSGINMSSFIIFPGYLNDDTPVLPLSSKDLLFIGLKSKKLVYKSIIDESDDKNDLKEEPGLKIRRDKYSRRWQLIRTSFPETEISSLASLYYYDKNSFWELILDKANETLEKYKQEYISIYLRKEEILEYFRQTSITEEELTQAFNRLLYHTEKRFKRAAKILERVQKEIKK